MDQTARDAWVHSGIEDLGGGIFRIPLPLPTDGLKAVNVYAIDCGAKLALIDGGWALEESRAALAAGLASIGCHLGDIAVMFVTHIHRDHYTQAVAIRREFGSRVSLGEGEQPNLQQILDQVAGSGPRTSDLDRLVSQGALALLEEFEGRKLEPGGSEGLNWEEPDAWLTDGEDLAVGGRTLRVVATPGHTRGHVVYRDDENGILFAGDHVLPHITPSIGFQPKPSDWPLKEYLESLRLVRSQPDARLLPAHGPVTESVHARVDQLLEHHDRRLEATLLAVEKGASTAYEAAGLLTWTRRERSFADLDLFNRFLAVSETAAHLGVLVLQGHLSVERSAEGVDIYTAAAAPAKR